MAYSTIEFQINIKCTFYRNKTKKRINIIKNKQNQKQKKTKQKNTKPHHHHHQMIWKQKAKQITV
jgi:hypothetical protein